MAVLDTDILIEFLKGDSEVNDLLVRVSKSEPLYTTYLNCYELLRGALSEDQSKEAEELLSNLVILNLDTSVVKFASKKYLELSKEGKRPPEFDHLIACICVVNDQRLLTKNVKDYCNYNELELI